jgi:hypothetical protein
MHPDPHNFSWITAAIFALHFGTKAPSWFWQILHEREREVLLIPGQHKA